MAGPIAFGHGLNHCSAILTPRGVTTACGFIIDGHIIEVRARGDYAGTVGTTHAAEPRDRRLLHAKADYGLFEPPAFNFGFISNNDFKFNGGPDIQALVDGEGTSTPTTRWTWGPRSSSTVTPPMSDAGNVNNLAGFLVRRGARGSP